MSSRRVLVTGAGGAVARGVLGELAARGHFVRAFDRRPVEGADEAQVGDIADGDAVERAVAGMDAVVHLAAQPDDAPFLGRLLQPNVVGLFNVLNAARHAEVRRVVLASSMQVVSGVRAGLDRLLTSDDAAPRNHYALTKLWAEQMGEMYARLHGMSVIGARIGWLTRTPQEADRLHRRGGHSDFLSHADAGRFFAAAVEAEFTGYATLYAVSRPDSRPIVDLDVARRLIGYEPQDEFPQGLPFQWSPPADAAPLR